MKFKDYTNKNNIGLINFLITHLIKIKPIGSKGIGSLMITLIQTLALYFCTSVANTHVQVYQQLDSGLLPWHKELWV